MDEREKWAPCCFHVSITELNQDKRTDILRKTDQKKKLHAHTKPYAHTSGERGATGRKRASSTDCMK